VKSLVLAEKPSVAKEIARVLGCHQKQKHFFEGPDYVVTWALGHLVTLAEPQDYDPKYNTWREEDLPILPSAMRLKVIKETSQQYRAIAQLVKRPDLNELIIATDAGREGELVARWIMELVKWKKPFKRLWISSQTDRAIQEGFAGLKPGYQYDNLYHSAQCRAEADWLIGLNVTRALTVRYNAQLSAGRVQTPTLTMIVEREQEIRNFKPVPYLRLQADFRAFQALWRSSATNESRIFAEEKAHKLLDKVKNQQGKVANIKKTPKQEPHPLAYDLTELQRDANRRYGFSAKQTSNVLQRLYEQHKLVTYPRTDSRYLTSDMVGTLKDRLKGMAVGPYASMIKPLLTASTLPITKRIVDDSKVTDHHAIIPTEQPLRLTDLSQDEKKLYDLIAKRFICLFYPAFRYETVDVSIEMGGESFYAKGRVVLDSGWRKVYGQAGATDEEAEEKEQLLPALNIGESLTPKKVELLKDFTKPPQRFSEAELLSQMEKNNLGTPATRADIIEKLIHANSIEREGNRLHPTPKGTQLVELVESELKSPELTAKWEKELEQIARGKGNPNQFLNNIRTRTKELVHEIKRSERNYKPHNLTGSKCPDCGEGLLEIKGKKGKMLVCSNRECHYRRSAEKTLLNKRCPQCKKKMELRTGKAGKYAHCRSCNVIEMLDDTQGHGKTNKRNERQLVNKYTAKEGLTSSLGDLLQAALNKRNEE
jgi:DNA topoisomerase III